MRLQRLIALLGLLVVVGSAAAIALNIVQDPLAVRRVALEQRIDEIQPPTDTPEAEKSGYAEWQRTIMSRPALWDSLTPPPPPPVKKINPKQDIQGFRILPGSTKDRVRLSKNAADRGSMYKVGDLVSETVTVEAINPGEVVFRVSREGQTASVALKRP